MKDPLGSLWTEPAGWLLGACALVLDYHLYFRINCLLFGFQNSTSGIGEVFRPRSGLGTAGAVLYRIRTLPGTPQIQGGNLTKQGGPCGGTSTCVRDHVAMGCRDGNGLSGEGCCDPSRIATIGRSGWDRSAIYTGLTPFRYVDDVLRPFGASVKGPRPVGCEATRRAEARVQPAERAEGLKT
jgi:hypothetical protein